MRGFNCTCGNRDTRHQLWDPNAVLPFSWIVSLENLSQGQVNWEGDGSSVYVSLLNNSPFPCYTWQQVVERGGHANSLSGAASGVSHTELLPQMQVMAGFVKLYKTPSNCSWIRGMNL